MKKENVCIGDLINVDVCQPKRGRFPIGRFNGIICKLTLPDNIKRLEYGCIVEARVAIIEPKYYSVLVEQVIVSAAANEAMCSTKMNALKDMYSKPAKVSKKTAKKYPYERGTKLINRI